MPIVSGGGVGFSVPFDASSSGTELATDNFGRLTITGKGGNNGELDIIDDSTTGLVILSNGRGFEGDEAAAAIVLLVGTDHIFQVDSTELKFHINAALIDSALSAGDCALWYDSTNGASKLMVKAKQADGTVKTAAVALA